MFFLPNYTQVLKTTVGVRLHLEEMLSMLEMWIELTVNKKKKFR